LRWLAGFAFVTDEETFVKEWSMLSTVSGVSVDVAQEAPRTARPRAETRMRLFMFEVGLWDLGDLGDEAST
jgi:hypothetical protein